MNPLTDQQLEEILSGDQKLPRDISPADRDRLTQMRSIRDRLARAGGVLRAPQGLGERIQTALQSAPGRMNFRWAWRVMVPLSAAALILLAVGLFLMTGQGEAQARIFQIHENNLAQKSDFKPCHEGGGISERLRCDCGCRVSFPDLGEDCAYLGSSLAKFRDKAVGCAVIQVGAKKVSVLRLDEAVDSLRFKHSIERSGGKWRLCGYKNCKMIAVEIRGHTFIAVGEADKETLLSILDRFVSEN